MQALDNKVCGQTQEAPHWMIFRTKPGLDCDFHSFCIRAGCVTVDASSVLLGLAQAVLMDYFLQMHLHFSISSMQTRFHKVKCPFIIFTDGNITLYSTSLKVTTVRSPPSLIFPWWRPSFVFCKIGDLN